jgi:hypothetical protein
MKIKLENGGTEEYYCCLCLKNAIVFGLWLLSLSGPVNSLSKRKSLGNDNKRYTHFCISHVSVYFIILPAGGEKI